jgi:NAD(P)H-quinone oxidoreductase subunit 5
LPHDTEFADRLVPKRVRLALYRLSLERGYLDAAIDEYVVRPFVRVFRWCDARERKWTDLLAGSQSRESDRVASTPVSSSELP